MKERIIGCLSGLGASAISGLICYLLFVELKMINDWNAWIIGVFCISFFAMFALGFLYRAGQAICGEL